MVSDTNVQVARDEAEIRRLVGAQREAMHEKNAAAAVAQFAPDAVIFDLAPPLRSVYGDAGKVQEWMNSWEGPIETETRELKLTISGDLALWYGYSRMAGRPREARDGVSFWMRMTLCLERVDGEWKVAHSHTSVPFYMDGSLRPAFDLEP